MIGLYFFTLKLLLIIDIMCVASALRILSALCWFEHLILIKIVSLTYASIQLIIAC